MKNIYFVQANNVYGNTRHSVYIPYASGCIAAYAFDNEKIKNSCRLAGFIYTHEPIKTAVSKLTDPFIVAFSCSVWNYEYNKALAKEIKKAYPEAVIIFGGHNVLRDFETFEECPEADILIYREGEEAFRQVVLSLLENKEPRSVSNIAYKSGGKYIKTKEEAFCLNEYPSPYLNGIFDGIADENVSFSAIIETNRGCPFKCAFCDWGTLGSRVRLFPMERIKAELDWIAEHKIEYVYCADGNFGIVDRDEDIAEYIISLKEKTGYPQNFRVCFTKNRTDFVKKICMRFNKHGLDKAQTLSFQSLSPVVLENIGRKNISLEHFRELMNEYNRLGISTSSELILGLPGETRESFTKGLCDLLEYGQHKAIQVYTCDLLPNSEMGSPEFVDKFGIETVKTPFSQAHCSANQKHEIQEYNSTVIKTASLNTDDWIFCVAFACIVQAFHNIGFFRAVAIYLRNELNISYYDIYSKIASFSQNPQNKACHSVFSLITSLTSGMSQGKNSWAVSCEGLGEICWQFDEIYFLKSLEKADELYNELEAFIKESFPFDEKINALFDYQRSILKRYGIKSKHEIKCDYDFYGYFSKIYKGDYSSLEKKENIISFSDGMSCADLYEYACKVIWYGRNQSAALYTSDCYKPEIKYY
ncbi:MAG: B12-binding domain-containing radical SAM protein [Clostridia bacterium]|nr:B12-binding domain-containing radical SAM protein [Clostridia bacterium]